MNRMPVDVLHVLSWDGEVVAQKRLPRAVQSIAIDSEKGILYALAPGAGAAFLAFDVASVVPELAQRVPAVGAR